MRDDWFGHRDYRNGRPIGDKDEWIQWDFHLIHALQIIEDNTDEYGLLAWERDDEAVEIDAVKKIHKFRASVDRITKGSAKKPYNPQPGEYFVPDMYSRRSDESIQTYGDWVRRMMPDPEED